MLMFTTKSRYRVSQKHTYVTNDKNQKWDLEQY